MLIISQDKRTLVNCDTIVYITIYMDAESKLWRMEAIYPTKEVILGIFHTKEEALEVLEDIRNSYKLVNKGTGYCYSIAERKLL